MVYWLAYLLKDSNGKSSSLAESRYFFIYSSDFKADRIQSIALIMMMPSIISPLRYSHYTFFYLSVN